MNRMRKKFATGAGMALVVAGILSFASAGAGLLNGIPAPAWVYASGLLGGLPTALFGIIVGIRYGNLERYHKDYDEETGTIDSWHPFARFAEWISKDDDPSADPPENFTPSRWMFAVAFGLLPFVLPVGFLAWAGLPTYLLVMGGVLFAAGGVFTFLVVELLAREFYENYP